MVDNSTSLFKIGTHIKFSDGSNIALNEILYGFKTFLLFNDLQENKWIAQAHVTHISLEHTSITIAVIEIHNLRKNKTMLELFCTELLNVK